MIRKKGNWKKWKKILKEKFNPDGFNIGINEGESAGQSIFHLHVHLIPRYIGDVKNPRGGVRNIFPKKAEYTPEIKKNSLRKDYVSDQPRIYEKLVRDRIPEIIESKGEVFYKDIHEAITKNPAPEEEL